MSTENQDKSEAHEEAGRLADPGPVRAASRRARHLGIAAMLLAALAAMWWYLEWTPTGPMAPVNRVHEEPDNAAQLLTQAEAAYEAGELSRSRQLALQARSVATATEARNIEVDALLAMARAELALGRPRDAATRYAAAESTARTNEDRASASSARFGLARARIAMGDYDAGRAIAGQLLDESVEAGRQHEQIAGYRLIADIHMRHGEWREAVTALRRVVDIALEIGDDELLTSAYAGLGRCWLELGDIDKAGVHIRHVLLERPTDPDTGRLHARLAAAVGNFEAAASVMRGARSRAGEAWTREDQELTDYYQARAIQAAAAD